MPILFHTGIYKLTNKVTGKVYVGSAACSFKSRWCIHRADLKGNRHFNSYLQRSWNKYGEEAFEFSILERCRPQNCLEREQHWLDKLRPYKREIGYNISEVAGSAMQGRNHTDASRLKMSVARKGMDTSKATEAAAKVTKGKRRSDEVRKKISDSHKGKTMSDEHKAKVKMNHWTKRPDAAEIRERSASKQRGVKRRFRNWLSTRESESSS